MPNPEFFQARSRNPHFPSVVRLQQTAIIPATLNKLSNLLVSTATATYAQLGLGFFAARYIYFLGRRPNSRASEAARHLKVDPAAVCRAGKTLRAEQLITEPKGIGRTQALTRKGRDVCNRIEIIADERETRLLKGFTATEATTLMDYLDRLTANMDHVAALTDEVPAILERKTAIEI